VGYLTPRNTSLSGLKVIEKEPVEDERGFLLRLFCAKELDTAGWTKSTPQVNWSLTKLKGAVRGLHFQMPPQPEMKIVTCIRGAVWDVQVDLRKMVGPHRVVRFEC
jgi:dTDP-4-dehydrorhamnose 3,5-epimerase